MSKEKIVIIDYGSGNLASAEKAFLHVIAQNKLSADILVSGRAEDVLSADRIVLPGQGAFGDCAKNLRASEGMVEALEEAVLKKGRPFLGICVGMQLLATRGLEFGVHAGLNWISGQVVPLKEKISDPAFKIPHMGWNEVFPASYEGASLDQDNRHFVLRSTESLGSEPIHYYFVHSYMFECEYNHHILGVTNYGVDFTSIVGKDNIIGMQFHPEKSQDAGLELLKNFVQWKP
jgi:glutamine amidotransferase